MTWTPIANTVPQYEDSNGDPYSGAVLKAYASGTTTPITMATSSSGVTTVGSIALNALGFPSVSGSVVIPHIDQAYKLALYPTQAAADANSGAIWTIDGMPLGRGRATTIVANAGDTVITVPVYQMDGSMVVCLNGVEQERGVAYTETSTTKITFSEPLQANDIITIKYL